MIEGRVVTDGPAFVDVDCKGPTVSLYANTPHTRWIITTWARGVDGRVFSYGTLYSADSRTESSIPALLSPMYDDGDDSVVRNGAIA